jgi:hypothetical protein
VAPRLFPLRVGGKPAAMVAQQKDIGRIGSRLEGRNPWPQKIPSGGVRRRHPAAPRVKWRRRAPPAPLPRSASPYREWRPCGCECRYPGSGSQAACAPVASAIGKSSRTSSLRPPDPATTGWPGRN